jgi:hypothetical protein
MNCCDICFNAYDNADHKPYTLVPCTHSICSTCIQSMNGNDCHICRRRIEQKVFNRLFLDNLVAQPRSSNTDKVIEYDIFISYNFSIKSQIDKLHERFNGLNLSVRRDTKEMRSNNSFLQKNIVTDIKNSKVVLCCINGKYCDSRNCKLEIGYASDIGKPLIILWIENLQINDIDQSIGFITSSLKKINCFANPNDWEAKKL